MQLNQVLTNRAGSRAVASQLYATTMAAKEQKVDTVQQIGGQNNKKKHNQPRRTLLDGLYYWMQELRFPMLIAVLYYIYFRRGKRLK